MQSRSIKQFRGRNTLTVSRIGSFVGGVLILLAIVFNGFITNTLSGVVAFIANPRADVYENVPRSVLVSRLRDAEDELSRVRYQGLLYALEVEKNQELAQVLGLPTSEVSARGRVFARPPKTHYDTLLVSLSDSAQVEIGDQAYASGVLVGEVVETSNRIARVSLYSAPGVTLDARVGEPSAIVVMRGLGGGAFFLEVPKEVAIQEGDAILLAQSETLVAVAQRIIDEPEQTTFRVNAASPVSATDMHVIEFVKTLPVFDEVVEEE